MYRETKEYLVSEPAILNGCKDIFHTQIENQGDMLMITISSEHAKDSDKLKTLSIGYSIEEAIEVVNMIETCIHRAKQALPKTNAES